ncbi:hypothetical protein U6G28_08365 [Actinomycetaceae bacterium MB13-C1-2]|nr:hypothetical protein U6G28_08365 [Actinomycetaceae bacterium MB13-C1-2]
MLAGRRKGETITLQMVLGRGSRPAVVPSKILDPSASVPELLLRGAGSAPTDTRRRVAQNAGQARIDVTVRVGVTAAVPERRQQLRGQFLSALEQLEAPGARLSLVNESPTRWEQATLGWSPLALTASQLVGVVAWPVDELGASRSAAPAPTAHPTTSWHHGEGVALCEEHRSGGREVYRDDDRGAAAACGYHGRDGVREE